MMLLQMASAPTTWELIVAIAGVASLFALLVVFGIAYGSLQQRLATLEKMQDAHAKESDVSLMFGEITRRLSRIEAHLDKGE
jgi:hypothetical protein